MGCPRFHWDGWTAGGWYDQGPAAKSSIESVLGICYFQLMKSNTLLMVIALAVAGQFNVTAQTNAPDTAAAEVHVNAAIIPVSRTGSITNRQSLVLQRAKEQPGKYDIEFIGDSITQGWEGSGKNVWQQYYGKRKVINMGVSGDRTEHVLWRFEQGQLDGIQAKVAVVMIGTNNSGKNRDGTDMYTDTDILEGVTAIVNEIRARQPDTKVLLLGIFPRGKAFGPQRGRLLEVNQALARLDDGKHIFYLDFGSQFIGNDGSISKDIMPDALHPNEAGYKIWANAMEPKLKQLLKMGWF
jgi:lysophospholipase L1-like esterase